MSIVGLAQRYPDFQLLLFDTGETDDRFDNFILIWTRFSLDFRPLGPAGYAPDMTRVVRAKSRPQAKAWSPQTRTLDQLIVFHR